MRCYSRRRCRLWVASGGCVPRSGRARGWVVPIVYSLWRRPPAVGGKAGMGGFAAWGILLAALRHFVGLSPGPSPSLRFWGGVIVWLCRMRRRRLAVTLMLHASLWLGSLGFGDRWSLVFVSVCSGLKNHYSLQNSDDSSIFTILTREKRSKIMA